jgi:hypothetical protein
MADLPLSAFAAETGMMRARSSIRQPAWMQGNHVKRSHD